MHRCGRPASSSKVRARRSTPSPSSAAGSPTTCRSSAGSRRRSPRAKIVSIKMAGASGSSDVSTIIAAIQWVVANRSTYGIRVLNLSLGTDSTQSYTIDPLDFAVEKAWQTGIVVNVAASNRGPAAGTVSKPADDPFVITVGAIDDNGTNGTNDDILPNFTGRGPTAADGLAKPDLVAPGAQLVSLAAPGAPITPPFPS